MPDPAALQQTADYITHLADDLKPWAPIALPLIGFGKRQAEALVSRFQEHFKHDAPETREQALHNASDAAQRIRDEVDRLIKDGGLTEDEARAAFARPDIAKHAQDALLAASETPDSLRHEELAKLIGARLVAPQDSRLTILLRMACDQLGYLNARQLRLLGLTFAVLYIEPHVPSLENADVAAHEEAYANYLAAIQSTVAPFRDLASPQFIEFLHFEELGLARLSSWSPYGVRTSNDVTQSGLLAPMQRDFYARALASADGLVTPDPTVQWVNGLMAGDASEDCFALNVVKLTPVGYLIGDCAYCIAHGQPFTLPDQWLDERA